MEDRKQFLDDVSTLMSLVLSVSLCVSSAVEYWNVQLLVDNIFDCLFEELVTLSNKGYHLSIKSVNNKISIVVRHPKYVPF